MAEENAIKRLPRNIKLLSEAVDALEEIIRRAETLKEAQIARVIPFVGLFWLYASAMRDLLRSHRTDRRMLWNAPALAALCRPLQESFLSFFYFGIEKTSDEEAGFRDLLLRRHQNYKRAELLSKSDQTVKEIAEGLATAKGEFKKIQDELVAHPYFLSLAPEKAKTIKDKCNRFIFEPPQEIWGRAGLSIELHEVVFRYLSQWVHATPYALGQLQFHQADKEDGAVNMNVPISLAITCVCRVLDLIAQMAPPLEEALPKGFREFVTEQLADQR